MQGFERTIISQYAGPIIQRLIFNLNDYLDPAPDFDAFYDLVWNVATAVGYGLDVWGRIVGVGRVVEVPSGEVYLGFAEQVPDVESLGNGVFYSGAGATSNYALTDAAYRTLIYAKALSNISNGSIPAINAILRTLFPGRGNCYCTDGGDMTMTYTFHFALTPVERAIISQSGVLAKPAGIVASIVVIP